MNGIYYSTDGLCAQGRNGCIKQRGICILPGLESIHILPISGRGPSYSCIIDIPYDRKVCMQVIEQLREALDKHESEMKQETADD